MECFSLMIAVCLLAGLSECQAGGDGGQIEINELTQEDLADARLENDALQNLNQELETQVVRTANSTTAPPSSEPPIYTVLKELGALEERLAATVRALEETNKKLEASESKLAALNSTVTELRTEDQATVRALEETNKKLEASERKLAALKSTFTELVRTVHQGQPRVAFSASLPVDGTIGPANVLYPLVYRHIAYNTGGHYNPHTGYFTAPVKGVYYFTFTSFCWESSSGSCGGSLYHNGNSIVSWYDYPKTHPSSRTNSAVLQLQVGDNVNVRLWHNRRINDNVNKYSSFSGFLLFPV